jgi:hypothetical protein
MRLDELPRGENIEHLRSKCRLADGFSIPGGSDDLGIGPAKSRAQAYRIADQGEGLQNCKFDSTIIKE